MAQIMGKEIRLVMIAGDVEYDLTGYVTDWQLNYDYFCENLFLMNSIADIPIRRHDPQITVTFSAYGPVIKRALGVQDGDGEEWKAKFKIDQNVPGYLEISDSSVLKRIENGDDDDEEFLEDYGNGDDREMYSLDEWVAKCHSNNVIECTCGQLNDADNEHCCFCGAELLV